MPENTKLPYTRLSEELNDKIADLMTDYNNFILKAKSYGLDVKLLVSSKNTLELYFNDDYPDTLLVDKDASLK